MLDLSRLAHFPFAESIITWAARQNVGSLIPDEDVICWAADDILYLNQEVVIDTDSVRLVVAKVYYNLIARSWIVRSVPATSDVDGSGTADF